jgi:DNA repair exonuclease SbcCD nuclease subunit
VVCNQRYETHIFDNIVIHGLPHINDETTQKTELQRIETIENKCNILMLHTSLGKDYMMTEFGEKMFPEEKYALLNQFDYIALGHWHNFQQVKGIKNAWYSGSTERLSDSEVRHEKGYCYITINDDNTASTPEFVGLNSRKWLKMLVKNCFEKSIDDILSEIKNLADDADVQDAIVGLMLENLTAPQSFNLKNTDIKAMFDGVFHLEIKRTRYQAASSDYSELNTENLADIADSFGGFVAGKYTDADQERTKAIIEIFTHYYNKNKTD